MPGYELVNAVYRVVSDAVEDVGEGLDCRGTFAASVGPGEGPVLPSESNAAQRTFCGVVVELALAALEVAPHALHASEGVADSLGELTLAGQLLRFHQGRPFRGADQ